MSVNTVASEHSGQRVFLKAGGEAHACELRAALPSTRYTPSNPDGTECLPKRVGSPQNGERNILLWACGKYLLCRTRNDKTRDVLGEPKCHQYWWHSCIDTEIHVLVEDLEVSGGQCYECHRSKAF